MDSNAIIGGIILGGLAIFGYVRMFSQGRGTKKLKAILPEAMVIDVRTTAEYKGGHFSGAINVPVEKLAKSTGRLGAKDAPKIVYCASGARARQAVRQMRMMGFMKVYAGGTLTDMEKLTG